MDWDLLGAAHSVTTAAMNRGWAEPSLSPAGDRGGAAGGAACGTAGRGSSGGGVAGAGSDNTASARRPLGQPGVRTHVRDRVAFLWVGL